MNDSPVDCQSRGVTESQRDGGPLAVDEVYFLTAVRYRISDFLTKTSSVSLRLPPSPKGKVTRFCKPLRFCAAVGFILASLREGGGTRSVTEGERERDEFMIVLFDFVNKMRGMRFVCALLWG